MSTQFYSTENLKLLVSICKDYMNDKYGLNLDKYEEEANLKKVLFDIMTIVNDENAGQNIRVQELNIDVLNRAKKYFIRKYNLGQNQNQNQNKPNMQNLVRDTDVYGNRQVNTSTTLIPDIDPYKRKNMINDTKAMSIENIENSRDDDLGIKKVIPDVTQLGPQVNEIAESTEDFLLKLKLLESERNKVDEARGEAPKQQVLSQYDNLQQNRMQVSRETNVMNSLTQFDTGDVRKKLYTNNFSEKPGLVPLVNEAFTEGKELSVIPRNLKQRLIEKYLSINSYDRDIISSPYRYAYTASFVNNRYRNIDSIGVTKIVIPDEIVQLNDPIKKAFNHDFVFTYPYLLLQIKEFDDVYDGTNNFVRKSFCTLLFDKSYKSQNGRGYVVLKPAQCEKKTFYPAPLSSLNKLTISILKPNGELFNTSADNYKILQITYDSTYPNYILITTNSYFDINEFDVGDNIVIKDFVMTNISISQNDFDIRTFNDFINNPNGLEIMLLGPENINKFTNSFYVKAPGAFDRSVGQYVVNNTLITCLNNYNAALVTPVANGQVVNYSLQHCISMKMNIIVDDASILDPQKNFSL